MLTQHEQPQIWPKLTRQAHELTQQDWRVPGTWLCLMECQHWHQFGIVLNANMQVEALLAAQHLLAAPHLLANAKCAPPDEALKAANTM